VSFKSFLAKPYAGYIVRDIHKWTNEPLRAQAFLFHKLILKARKTKFGEEHGFANISTHEQYCNQVPLRDYEGLKSYIELIKQGQANVLWPGKPIYFAKSSGTTSGVKYIPITKESIHNHINSARNALLLYISNKGNSNFVNGHMIFLSGSPVLEQINGIYTGRLSGIVNHHVPAYLRSNQLPSYKTNCIEDWETKVDAIVEETYNKNLTLISGIPPWVQMYFDRLLIKTGKKNIKEVFPHLQLLVYGGVNFEPYKRKIFETIGEEIDSIETYPASEGFIAYQDLIQNEGLLLNVDSGIFFEFVPVQEIHHANPTRLTLHDVELDKQYAIVLSSNAGLWSYVIGDTVKFVSLKPFRIVVTGRIKHFISAFGEHVIAEEVESALSMACKQFDAQVTEFTVAPQVTVAAGLPYHEWFIEFAKAPEDLDAFRLYLDELMQQKNIYYADLIRGKVLAPLKITVMQTNAFVNYMKSKGKLGGQNKLPRLKNDRSIADELTGLK
jgi:hypothetical protein